VSIPIIHQKDLLEGKRSAVSNQLSAKTRRFYQQAMLPRVRSWTAIFLPVINAECSTIEGNGITEKDLRACAKDLMDHTTLVEARVDRVALKNLKNSRVESKLFSFTLPPGDLLGLFGKEPNPNPSVSDGFWVLLKPLSPGEHTIEVHGVLDFPEIPFIVDQKVTYHVTVVPELP